MQRLLPPLVLALALAGCGDDGVDRKAVQAAMPGFIATHAASFGSLDLPVFNDDVLLAFVPPGEDAVALCDELADYVDDEGFGGVRIRVHRGLGGAALATGESGGTCSAE